MTHIAPLLSVALFSSLLIWTAAESSILCSWTKVLPNGEVHSNFLRRDPLQASPSPRLYHSVWSGERAPLRCAWSDDAAVIHNYLSACRERAHEFSDHPDETIDVESMLVSEELCVSVASPGDGGHAPAENHQGQAERSEVRTHRRVKRGFIVPGTLWCGSGNKAPSFEDLGVFEDTDSCCREHDQCKHTILSFHSQFGVFNSNIFTMSHCDCDNKFHSCLMAANDRIAEAVGYTFFNLLKMHCFEFSHRLQCTERNWFGMCKETKMALYAEVHPPTPYNSSNPTEVSVNTTAPTETPGTSNSTASTLPPPSTSSHSASVAPPVTDGATSPSPGLTGSAPERGDDVENTLPTKKQTLSGMDVTEKQLSECDVYKELDECRSKILPQKKKYGLYNPEARTLYHCNCTSRLFQTLAKQRQLTEVQTLLLGHVSQSCFLPQDCTSGQICAAVVVRAELPPEDQRSRADAEEQRHLQAVQLKVRRPNVRRAKRKDRAVRLHKLCLRVLRPTDNQNRTRTRGQDPRGSAVRGGEVV